ncbi:MAG: hypothetical protein DLM50_09330 [Candidatus Meridianibacter frigidus]|nr:MAG: hypothetical protein DLM50_09330 [Candidatus Eremiobacteraeota bacterium]
MAPVLFRFCRDLRVEDHAGLARAAALGPIVPVLVLDDALIARLKYSSRRASFFCHAVESLDRALRERGSQLTVRRGPLVATLRALAKGAQAQGVVWSYSYDAQGIRDEAELQSAFEESGLRAIGVHDAPAVPPEETTAAKASPGDGYVALAPYAEVWRAAEMASYEAPLLLRFAQADLTNEPLPSPHEFGCTDTEERASAALASDQLRHFLEYDAPQYTEAVNVPAEDRTSRLSAHLSFGTIAARSIVRETQQRAENGLLLAEERASFRRFLRSLAQRDFFLQLAWYHCADEKRSLQEKMRTFPFAEKHAELESWKEGRTGYPLVDAGIRQLHQTGWMHPRVRSVAASFLCFDLGVDWRVGLQEWDRHLIEDDPALAIGNWQWVAGVGADLAAYPRIYNPIKQARRFDPHGKYVRHWIPELAHRPAVLLRSPEALALELPLYGSAGYPQPVLDHAREARAFLSSYNEFIGQAGVPQSSPR